MPHYADEDPLTPRRWLDRALLTLGAAKQLVRDALNQRHADIDRRIRRIEETTRRLENRMTSMEQNEQARWEEAARVAGLIVAEVRSLRPQLEAAIADKQAAVDAGVASALGEEAQRDIARLDELTALLSGALPVPVPEVPTPDPGEPAVDPDSGQSSDDVVSEGGSSDGGVSEG